MIIGPHWFYRKKYEKTHSAPEYTRGPRQGDIFCPRVYSGSAFKGLNGNGKALKSYGEALKCDGEALKDGE